jgi:hypothetical protein
MDLRPLIGENDRLTSTGRRMNTDQAYEQRMQAHLRAADARIDELDAAARARNAQAEMNEISGLRAHRDRVRQLLDDMDAVKEEDLQALRAQAEDDWTNLRRALADVHTRYIAWDRAREDRFNAHVQQAEAALRRAKAEDQAVAADVRANIAASRDDLKSAVARAKQRYNDWRERREDRAAIKELTEADIELDDAIERYAWAVGGVVDRVDR